MPRLLHVSSIIKFYTIIKLQNKLYNYTLMLNWSKLYNNINLLYSYIYYNTTHYAL